MKKDLPKPIKSTFKVIERRDLTPTVFELILKSEAEFKFIAGQYVSVVVPGAGPGGRNLRRAYSIASHPEKSELELCIKLFPHGKGSVYLSKLKVGDSFEGNAPFGEFVLETTTSRVACFVATGTGLAPYRSIVLSEQFRKNPPIKTQVLFGVREEIEVFYESDFVGLPGVELVTAASRPVGAWQGFKGRVTDYLRKNPSEFDWKNTDFYLCGAGEMITEVKAILTEYRVSDDHIYQEKYF